MVLKDCKGGWRHIYYLSIIEKFDSSILQASSSAPHHCLHNLVTRLTGERSASIKMRLSCYLRKHGGDLVIMLFPQCLNFRLRLHVSRRRGLWLFLHCHRSQLRSPQPPTQSFQVTHLQTTLGAPAGTHERRVWRPTGLYLRDTGSVHPLKALGCNSLCLVYASQCPGFWRRAPQTVSSVCIAL